MAKGRRDPKGKKINPTLFVFCEGNTEVAYINLLKSIYRIPSIHIHPKISGTNITSEYINNYKKDKPTHEKDIDYLLYDLDVPEIIERLKRIGDSILLLSNPCIEVWFLLHYKNQTAHITGVQCCREMRNRNRVYNKGAIDSKLKERLTSNREDAAKRAKRLTEYRNPSSTIYILLEKLDELRRH